MSTRIDAQPRRATRQNFKFGAAKGRNAGSTPRDSETSFDQSSGGVEEKLASLFEPDTVATTQYFDNLRRKTVLDPEKRLVLAILEDAIYTYQDNVTATGSKARKLFNDTEEWITQADGDWIFSFTSVCEILGLSPEYVRRGLVRWKEKKLSDRAQDAWQTTKMAG
jgi:hypothetical protein